MFVWLAVPMEVRGLPCVWTVWTQSYNLSNRTNELKVAKSWRSHRLGGWLSVRSAALLSITLQRVMSQCWLQLLNGAFYTKWLAFLVKIYSQAFPIAQFCRTLTKQSVMSDSSSETAKDRSNLAVFLISTVSCSTVNCLFPLGACIQSFIHSLAASHLIYCLKRKGKLYFHAKWECWSTANSGYLMAFPTQHDPVSMLVGVVALKSNVHNT